MHQSGLLSTHLSITNQQIFSLHIIGPTTHSSKVLVKMFHFQVLKLWRKGKAHQYLEALQRQFYEPYIWPPCPALPLSDSVINKFWNILNIIIGHSFFFCIIFVFTRDKGIFVWVVGARMFEQKTFIIISITMSEITNAISKKNRVQLTVLQRINYTNHYSTRCF